MTSDEKQNGADLEGSAVTHRTFDLDLAALDHDESVLPFASVVGARRAGRDGDHPLLEGGVETSFEERYRIRSLEKQ